MIGADEFTVDNDHGCVVIVRRGPNAAAAVKSFRDKCAELGVDMKLPADEIRRIVGQNGFKL